MKECVEPGVSVNNHASCVIMFTEKGNKHRKQKLAESGVDATYITPVLPRNVHCNTSAHSVCKPWNLCLVSRVSTKRLSSILWRNTTTETTYLFHIHIHRLQFTSLKGKGFFATILKPLFQDPERSLSWNHVGTCPDTRRCFTLECNQRIWSIHSRMLADCQTGCMAHDKLGDPGWSSHKKQLNGTLTFSCIPAKRKLQHWNSSSGERSRTAFL